MGSFMSDGDDRTIIRPRPGKKPSGHSGGSTGADKTVIRPKPKPGGSKSPSSGSADSDATQVKGKRGARAVKQINSEDLSLNHSPLMDAASPILSLVTQLRQLDGKVNVPSIHQQVTRLLQTFHQKLKDNVDDSEIRHNASYVLCATIDETALNTSWGEYSAWSQRPQLSIFHKETYGGERIYDMLEEVIVSPSRNYELIELIYYCLSLGFMGKLRIDPQGPVKLEQTRSNIYDVLHRSRERHNNVLSGNIAPAAGFASKLHSFVPVWIAAGLLVLAAFSLYNYWFIWLDDRAKIAQVQLQNVIPKGQDTSIQGFGTPDYVVTLREILATEIEREVVSVDYQANTSSITLHSEELFEPSSVDIDQGFKPILRKIARALEKVPGRIIVEGHTDNIKINTAQFPSNYRLSLERANSVTDFLSQAASLDSRILPEGLAETQPIADNATAEGRAKNRRVVVKVKHNE